MKNILLVEDTVQLADVIIRELHARGYEVVHAPDGETALDYLREDHAANAFDLVILDWMLPGLDGLEVLRRLRGERITPVLMLTARDEEADRVLG
ncbi:MAG TPA: response regulator, partial [Aggregatilineales bacterium]|nr:response regulator [Aggregatilineales bacterium]